MQAIVLVFLRLIDSIENVNPKYDNECQNSALVYSLSDSN